MAHGLTLFVFIVGLESLFSVTIESSETVGDLKQSIFAKNKNALKDVAADQLALYRVEIRGEETRALAQLAAEAVNGTRPLSSLRRLSKIFPTDPPEETINIVVTLGNTMSRPTLACMPEGVCDSALVARYAGTFVKVKAWGAFRQSDINENRIYECYTVPDFVAELEQELDRKPGVSPDAGDFVERIDPRFWNAYFEASQEHEEFSSESGSHQGRRRDAKESEMFHLGYVACVQWERLWNGDLGSSLKELSMIALHFYFFALQACGPVTAKLSDQSWPFKLIATCETAAVNEQFRKYEPRSDLLILKLSLPRLLIQVNSKPQGAWPEDLIRMFVTGAAVVRFANTFLDTYKEKNFVLFAIYVWDNGQVSRYSLFQDPQGLAVRYKETKYWLNNPAGRAKFIRELYNFSHMLEKEGETIDTNMKIAEFKANIDQHDATFPMKSFFAKDDQGINNNGSKKRRLDKDIGDSSGASRAGGVNTTDCAELRAHGYEVKPEAGDIVDPGGKFVFEAFKIQVPSHILTVYQPSDPRKEFIAKKVRSESNELQILKFLNTFQPQHEHIVSLHDSFQTELTSWAILPKLDSVADYVEFSPNKIYQNVTEVCWGLIKGVAFLHKHRIAHRDIKPHNLLVDRDFCLKIIDFDIAMQVKDENEEVDGQCGTEHWIAPEIEEKLMYSPIKADRWSTGKVLQYLLEQSRRGESLMMIARKLTARNPKLRPSMLEITAPLLDVDNVVSERKAS